MPFVTEEIYQSLPGSEGFLMKASWPTVCSLASAKTAENVGQLMELVRSIRNLRRELNVPVSYTHLDVYKRQEHYGAAAYGSCIG